MTSAHTCQRRPFGVKACSAWTRKPRRAPVQFAGAAHHRFGRVTSASVVSWTSQGDRLSRQALPRPVGVGAEHLGEGDLGVVEEAVGGGHLGAAAAGRRDAEVRPLSQCRQQQGEALVHRASSRSAVTSSSCTQGSDHCATPLTPTVATHPWPTMIAYLLQLAKPNW